MQKGFVVKGLVVGAFAGLMVGCGGGGDDGGGFSPPPESELVSGQFYDARITDDWYTNDYYSMGYYGEPCVGEHNYFETDDGLIKAYGTAGISETDFKVVSTLVSERFDGALSKFGLDRETFIAKRNLFVPGHARSLASYVSDYGPYQGQYDLTDAEKVAIWMGWSDEEKRALNQAIRDDEEQLGFTQEPWEYFDEVDKDTIEICLNTQMGGSMIGEGSYVGILMAANTNQYPGGSGEIITHELVHHIQDNVSRVGGQGFRLPRWFSEGQAVYLAGQRRASPSEHYNYEPLQVTGFYDEYGDVGEAYRHYGLAYWYLHKANGMEKILELLELMKTNTDNPFEAHFPERDWQIPGQPTGFAVSESFQRAFDATMVDHNGDPLTIERFQDEYHDLMNQMY